MFELYFLIFGPAIGLVLGAVIGIIVSVGRNGGGSKHISSYYSGPSNLESEIRSHNARVEQMLIEQENRRSSEELSRIIHENDCSLADKLDTRLTNIFRNPWEEIL